MMLDAICIIQGPGDIGLVESEGILYIYTKDKIADMPADKGRIYTIEEGYNRFWLGEPDTVRSQVSSMYQPIEPVEVEV